MKGDKMKSDYYERKENRIERYNELAEKHEQTSNTLHEKARKLSDYIPFGQPILVGHHSERRDRNFRNKIHNTFEKSIEEQNKADYYAQKAKSAENNNAISSDDPEAVLKLKEKIERLEKSQELMRAANKIIKRKSETKEEKIIELQE
jgi:ATP-dependent Lon protease